MQAASATVFEPCAIGSRGRYHHTGVFEIISNTMKHYTTTQLQGKLLTAMAGGYAIFTVAELTAELKRRNVL